MMMFLWLPCSSSPLQSVPRCKARRVERGDGRQLARVALDLHQAAVCDAALAEFRAALVERQHVRIAVLVEGADVPGLERVVPRAGRHLHDAETQTLHDAQSRQTGAAPIEDAHDIAGGEPA